MARRPQETTRLIREATSAVINKIENNYGAMFSLKGLCHGEFAVFWPKLLKYKEQT